MNWIERCPECGGIDYRGTVRHVVRYLTSSGYRKVCREAERVAGVLERLIQKGWRLHEGSGDTIHIPKIGRLTSEETVSPEAP